MSSEGKLRLAVFDWAGTTVDYGSSAPMRVFEQVFQEAGIHLTREEINGEKGAYPHASLTGKRVGAMEGTLREKLE